MDRWTDAKNRMGSGVRNVLTQNRPTKCSIAIVLIKEQKEVVQM
jgi:hypothetical protein